jgi:tellurite resistance protein
MDELKDEMILIRIKAQKKKDWKNLCSKKQISMTSLIINSVDNRIMDDERRKILTFIEKQDNIFGKIENNINQVAKIANGQKFIRENELRNFSNKLLEIVILKKEQNEIFTKIYEKLAR